MLINKKKKVEKTIKSKYDKLEHELKRLAITMSLHIRKQKTLKNSSACERVPAYQYPSVCVSISNIHLIDSHAHKLRLQFIHKLIEALPLRGPISKADKWFNVTFLSH